MGEFEYIGTAALIAKGMAAVESAVVESAEDFVAQAMAATPVDTGTLRASEHVDSIRVGGMEVVATVATGGEASEYAIPIHEGWVAHWIRAKVGSGLWWPGASHPVAAVFNPGHAGYKFFERPLLANRALYVLAMQRAAAGEF